MRELSRDYGVYLKHFFEHIFFLSQFLFLINIYNNKISYVSQIFIKKICVNALSLNEK